MSLWVSLEMNLLASNKKSEVPHGSPDEMYQVTGEKWGDINNVMGRGLFFHCFFAWPRFWVFIIPGHRWPIMRKLAKARIQSRKKKLYVKIHTWVWRENCISILAAFFWFTLLYWYLYKVLHGDLIQTSLLHNILAGHLYLISPATLLQLCYQLNLLTTT